MLNYFHLEQINYLDLHADEARHVLTTKFPGRIQQLKGNIREVIAEIELQLCHNNCWNTLYKKEKNQITFH